MADGRGPATRPWIRPRPAMATRVGPRRGRVRRPSRERGRPVAKITRRFFLGSLGIATLAGRSASATQANERIMVGVIGAGRRGSELAVRFANIDGVEVASVCDVDREASAKTGASVASVARRTPRVETDLRR